MSEEEFFERLRERAVESLELPPELYDKRLMWTKDFESGINATIKALKGMMVGEPTPKILRELRTRIPGLDRTLTPGAIFLDHGTDGEGVVVMVFRSE